MPRKTSTRYMRWNELCRAALILGVIDDYSKASCRGKIATIIERRVKAGLVRKMKRGESQSLHQHSTPPTLSGMPRPKPNASEHAPLDCMSFA